MPAALTVELIDLARATVPAVLADAARRLPRLVYADMRLEVTESRHAIAENGAERSSGDDYACTAGVRVLAGDRALAPGWIGIVLGTADVPALERRLAEALERAYRRAMANAEHKATARRYARSRASAIVRSMSGRSAAPSVRPTQPAATPRCPASTRTPAVHA